MSEIHKRSKDGVAPACWSSLDEADDEDDDEDEDAIDLLREWDQNRNPRKHHGRILAGSH